MHLALHVGHQHGFGRRFQHRAHARLLVLLALADVADDAAGLRSGPIRGACQHGAARQQPAPVAVAVAQTEFASEGAVRLAIQMLPKCKTQARAVVAVHFGQPVGQCMLEPGALVAQHVLVLGRKLQAVGMAPPGPASQGRAAQGLPRILFAQGMGGQEPVAQLLPQPPGLPASQSRQGGGAGGSVRPQQCRRHAVYRRLHRQRECHACRQYHASEPTQRRAPSARCAETRVAAIRQMHPFLGHD